MCFFVMQSENNLTIRRNIRLLKALLRMAFDNYYDSFFNGVIVAPVMVRKMLCDSFVSMMVLIS